MLDPVKASMERRVTCRVTCNAMRQSANKLAAKPTTPASDLQQRPEQVSDFRVLKPKP